MINLAHLNSWHSDWKNIRAVVYGVGITGFSVADTLNELGAKVLVIADRADEKQLDVLDVLGVEHMIGQSSEQALRTFSEFQPDLVLVSPGIKPTSELLAKAAELSVPIWTDIDLAWRLRDKFGAKSKWVCITGTNGKTTVTQLVEAMLHSAGLRAAACGNIGIPILDVIRDPAAFEVLVLELSSFQLHYLGAIEPVVSVVLNIADDHLDWHGSADAYAQAKAKIYDNTSICCVYNAGDAQTEKMITQSIGTENAQAVGFTVSTPAPNEIGWVEDLLVDRAFIDDPAFAEELATLEDLRNISVIGPHLLANVAAAASISRALGVQSSEIKAALQGFNLDSHRIQLVLDQDGVRWVDDSKATNPHAAAAALATFESVIWIVGGLLKGVDIAPLVKRYANRVKAAVIIGQDRDALVQAFESFAPEIPRFEVTASDELVMPVAIEYALAQAKPGDVVLLAPAGASMDQFRDYAHRGEAFAEAIRLGVLKNNG